jgi:transcriptional regulator with XRE-family HTH domain
MSDSRAAQALRAKIIGVLIKEARLSARKTGKECAEAVGCPPAVFTAYEQGQRCPSLPELELLAFFLEVPPEHFWGDRSLAETKAEGPSVQAVMRLRDRIIGAELRQARTAAKLKVKDFAAGAGLSSGRLSAYEVGEKPIPLTELEVITDRLGISVKDLLEEHGKVGEWESVHQAAERFRQLSPDLRDFISQPANESFLRLAQRLSAMPTDQLRQLAESLLEITY